MTKKATELVKYIKKILTMYRPHVKSYYEKFKIDDACDFISRLETVENDLINGGYIIDCNGTACKSGDKVVILDESMNYPLGFTLIYENYAFHLKQGCISIPMDKNFVIKRI